MKSLCYRFFPVHRSISMAAHHTMLFVALIDSCMQLMQAEAMKERDRIFLESRYFAFFLLL